MIPGVWRTARSLYLTQMFGYKRAGGHNDEISKLIREKGQLGLYMELRLLEAPPKNNDRTWHLEIHCLEELLNWTIIYY